MTKRNIYISLFTLFGIVLSFLIHAAIEIPILNLFIKNFNKYGLGLTWDNWYLIHNIISFALLFCGIIFGYHQGKYWWRVIYIEKRYKNK